jgi:hypothetical protein
VSPRLREGKQRVARRPRRRLHHPLTTGEERVHPVVKAESRDQKGQCHRRLPGRTVAADDEGLRQTPKVHRSDVGALRGKIGAQEKDAEGDETKDAYDVVKEAERIVEESR